MSEDEPAEEAPRPAAPVGGEEQIAAPVDDGAPVEQPARARKSKKKRRSAPERSAEPAEDAADAPAAKATEEEPAEEEPAAADEGEAAAAAARPDVPAFALHFPSDPVLDELVRAFEQGNYARVRREAPALARSTDRPEVRKAARELARRLDPDPIAVYLLIAAAVLLVFLATWFWTHPHEAPL